MRPSAVILGLLLVGSCVGGERATGPDVAELALAIQPALIPSAADGSALPIRRIRAVAARQPDGALLREQSFDVSPTAASWTLELAIPVGRESTEVVVHLDLLNVASDGTESLQFSGRTAPLTVSSGTRLANVEADIVRGPPSNLSVTSVTITSSPDTLYVGASSTLSATVTSAASTPPQVFWTSLDPSVLGAVDSVATGVSSGAAQIVASAGAHADTAGVVVIVPPVDSVRVSPDSADVQVGQTRSYTAQLFDASGNVLTGRPITWTTANCACATVDAFGVVTGVAPGTTTVRATSEGVFDEAVVRVTAAPAPGGGNTWTAIRSGNWSDPTGWSLNRIPQAGDTVYLTANDDHTITLDVDATVARLVLGGTTDVISLNVDANDLTVSGDIVLGPLAHLQVTTGTIAASVILNDGTVRVLGAATIDADIENYDDWRISGLNSSMTMTRAGGGYFYNEGALGIDTTAVLSMGPEGYLEFAGGAATLSDAGVALIGPVGRLILDQDLTIDGPHIILVESEIDQVSNSRLTIGTQSLLQLTATSAQAIVAPKLEVQGTLFVSGPDVAMEDSLIVADGGVVEVDGSAGATAYRTIGVQNDGTVLMSGTNPVSFGPGSNSQSLTNLTNGIIQIGPGGDRVINGQLLNQGRILVAGPTTLRRSTSPDGTSPVTANHVNSGIIDLFVGGSLDVELGGASPTFTNSGPIVVPGGTTLSVENLASPAGQIINGVGGVIAGTGTVDVRAGVPGGVNNGVIAPGVSPGILTWLGSIPMGPTGGIEIELDGTTPGTGHDQLNVSSSLVLNGNGVLDVTAAFVPAVGDRFPILTFVGRQGTFGTVNRPSISGIVLDTVWVDNTVDTLYLVASAAGPAAPVNRWQAAVSGAWSVGTYWSQGTVPDAADSVVIDVDGFYTITLDVDASARNLMLGGSLGQQNLVAITPRTLTLGAASVIDTNGRLNLPGATINGTGSLTTIGQTTFDGNTVNVPITNPGWLQIGGTTALNGSLTTTATSLLRVGGVGTTADITIANGFTNNGALELTSASAANTTLTVTGTLTNAGTLSVLVGLGGAKTLAAALDNQGTVSLTTDGLTLAAANATHTNSGTINVSGANLTMNQTAGGSFTNQVGGTVNIGATRFFLVEGSGTFDVANGLVAGAGTLYPRGTTSFQFNTASVSSAISFLSTITINSGSITVPANDTLTIHGGIIDEPVVNSGTIIAANLVSFGGGLSTNPGSTLRVVGGAGAFNQASSVGVPGAAWVNNGTIELTSQAPGVNTNLNVSLGGLSVTNAAGATLTTSVGTGGTRTLPSLTNSGTVVFDVSTGVGSLDQLNAATLTLAAGQTLTASGLMQLFTGSTTTALSGATVVKNGGCSPLGGLFTGFTCP